MADKTVVQILDFVPNGCRTMEQFLCSLAERLLARGWRTVHVFAGEPGDYMRARLRELDSPYLIARFQPTVRQAAALGWRLRQYRPDVIQTTFMNKFSLALPVLKAAAGARLLVFTDQSSGFASRKSLPGRLLTRLRGRLAGLYIDRLVAVSAFVGRRDVADMHYPAGRMRVVLNGVDIQKFAPPAAAPAGQDLTLAFAGRLDAGKGVLTLLRAVRQLADSGLGIRLLVAGRGPQEAELRAFCAANGVADRVTFLGQIDWLPRLFGTADVAVFPSQYGEAFGFVVAEAMAAGGCVLAAADGGIPEIVGPGGVAGDLFPPGDVDELTVKLRALLADPDRRARMRAAARARAVELFSLAGMVDGHVGVFDELEAGLAGSLPAVARPDLQWAN